MKYRYRGGFPSYRTGMWPTNYVWNLEGMQGYRCSPVVSPSKHCRAPSSLWNLTSFSMIQYYFHWWETCCLIAQRRNAASFFLNVKFPTRVRHSCSCCDAFRVWLCIATDWVCKDIPTFNENVCLNWLIICVKRNCWLVN